MPRLAVPRFCDTASRRISLHSRQASRHGHFDRFQRRTSALVIPRPGSYRFSALRLAADWRALSGDEVSVSKRLPAAKPDGARGRVWEDAAPSGWPHDRRSRHFLGSFNVANATTGKMPIKLSWI
jgi:hypothetical protein